MTMRCVCGHSKTYPLCDGSHKSQGWSCGREGQVHYEHGVISSAHYRTLAQKWAHHKEGVVVEEMTESLHCSTLWILCDGSDLPSLRHHRTRVQAGQVILVAIGISEQILGGLGHFDSSISINPEESLWVQLQKGVQNTIVPTQPQKIFLSHAVVDEHQWVAPILSLRNTLGIEIFSCSDSIIAGGNWYEEITSHLADSDWVLCLLSRGFLQSTFCAFEVGMARALNKRIYVISVDGSLPPSFAQDIQMEDIPRYCALRPWLSSAEGVLECVLRFAGTMDTPIVDTHQI